ncbi:MAG TPA: sugar phosphate isomerase/epimerase family protein [Spirochaetia bacterium]|nr:sugar phosphate isomerase/epimerase family protein [Spirochaetia bacterium]
MSSRYKVASGFAPFSPCADRFNPAGYDDRLTLEEQFGAASGIKGFGGVALDYPYQFTDAREVKPLLQETGLAFVTLEIGLYPDRKWKNGTYTAPDPGIRREAIEMSRKALDVAAELEAVDVLMWPGQDGFDYPFQSDYQKTWTLLVDAVGEIAAHRPDVKIAIEYKKQEPRANCYVRNAGVLLSLLRELDLENVGGCIDLGHSLAAGENPAEAAVLLHRAGRLFQVHLNDNYRDWDHDLIVGSVTFWETLEFFYWLRRCGWDGWYILDIFPYRIDGGSALQEGVNRTIRFIQLAERIGTDTLQESLSRSDVLSAARELWGELFR